MSCQKTEETEEYAEEVVAFSGFWMHLIISINTMNVIWSDVFLTTLGSGQAQNISEPVSPACAQIHKTLLNRVKKAENKCGNTMVSLVAMLKTKHCVTLWNVVMNNMKSSKDSICIQEKHECKRFKKRKPDFIMKGICNTKQVCFAFPALLDVAKMCKQFVSFLQYTDNKRNNNNMTK